MDIGMLDVGHVLVVEDNPVIGEVIATALSDEGFEVSLAWNGDQALKAMTSFRPDLVILDMWLPIMPGQTFLEVHRKSNSGHIPVIAITASLHLAGKAKALGADEVFHKPFDLNKLVESVKKHLPARGSQPVH